MIKYTVEVYESGHKSWRLNGKLHREDGPAVELVDGSKSWWLNGEKHREDGPAVEYVDGTKAWYLNGKLHREDGPALEFSDGFKVWCLNGKRLTEEEHKKAITPPKPSCEGDIYIQLQEAYEAGWNGSIDRVVSDRVTEAGGWVEIHYDDFIGYKIGFHMAQEDVNK